MTDRIIFEDIEGTRVGQVDHKGKKLVANNDFAQSMVNHYLDTQGDDPEGFMQKYADYRSNFVYSRITDAKADDER